MKKYKRGLPVVIDNQQFGGEIDDHSSCYGELVIYDQEALEDFCYEKWDNLESEIIDNSYDDMHHILKMEGIVGVIEYYTTTENEAEVKWFQKWLDDNEFDRYVIEEEYL